MFWWSTLIQCRYKQAREKAQAEDKARKHEMETGLSESRRNNLADKATAEKEAERAELEESRFKSETIRAVIGVVSPGRWKLWRRVYIHMILRSRDSVYVYRFV